MGTQFAKKKKEEEIRQKLSKKRSFEIEDKEVA